MRSPCGPPHDGCCNATRRFPHSVQRANCRSISCHPSGRHGMTNGAVATARMCGQRTHLVQHHWMWSGLVTRGGIGGLRRQSRTVMQPSGGHRSLVMPFWIRCVCVPNASTSFTLRHAKPVCYPAQTSRNSAGIARHRRAMRLRKCGGPGGAPRCRSLRVGATESPRSEMAGGAGVGECPKPSRQWGSVVTDYPHMLNRSPDTDTVWIALAVIVLASVVLAASDVVLTFMR